MHYNIFTMYDTFTIINRFHIFFFHDVVSLHSLLYIICLLSYSSHPVTSDRVAHAHKHKHILQHGIAHYLHHSSMLWASVDGCDISTPFLGEVPQL